MSDGPGARQWDEGKKASRHEYTGFRTRDPVAGSRLFHRSAKPTALQTVLEVCYHSDTQSRSSSATQGWLEFQGGGTEFEFQNIVF